MNLPPVLEGRPLRGPPVSDQGLPELKQPLRGGHGCRDSGRGRGAVAAHRQRNGRWNGGKF